MTTLKPSLSGSRTLVCLALLTTPAFAQARASSSSTVRLSPLEQGFDLAAKGHCEEALTLLKKFTLRVTDKQLKYRAQMATVRCAIKRKDGQATVSALMALRHDYPEDPEVLYLTTQIFLQIAENASQDLVRIAPNSYQVRKLEAETLESQSKWAQAASIYRKMLEENPNLPEIHFRLGRAAMSQPESPDSTEEAKKEFEHELAIDPTDASAEFWLGEIAHRDGQWDEAISRFTSATKLDSSLSPALLGLGMALNSAGRFREAIALLEHYTTTVPEDAAGHYQLAMAYARTGRKEDAAREMALQQKLYEKRKATAESQTSAAPN